MNILPKCAEKIVTNRQGLSLIEVMLLSAAGIAVGSALLSSNLNIARLQKQIETRSEMAAWKTLAGQYLSKQDSGVCEALIQKGAPEQGNRELPSEETLCGQLRDSEGKTACDTLAVALKPGTRESCNSVDPTAVEGARCPEVFMQQNYPNLASLPPPAGFSGQSMRLVLPKITRGPNYAETKPEYLVPLQLVIQRTEPRLEVQALEPGLVTLRLKGGSGSDKRLIESCSLGAGVAPAEAPIVNFRCLPGQVLIGIEDGEPLCSPEEPCKVGQQLVLLAGEPDENGEVQPDTWACGDPPRAPEQLDDAGLVSLCLGDCS